MNRIRISIDQAKETMGAEIKRLREENGRLQSAVRLVQRAVSEAPLESAENMSSLNLEHAERLLILEALSRSRGSRTIACEMLGIARSTLFMKMKIFGIKDNYSRTNRKKD